LNIIIMSSRSLAAARAKRAGESAPPVSGSRPGTSIGSHAAFAQPPGYQQQQPSNVRVGKGVASNQPSSQQSKQSQQQQQSATNGAPFTKLSISDAIGLITLRLGRVEQWIFETEHDGSVNNTNHSSSAQNVPENSRVIDLSVLTSIINRLDLLETSGPAGASGEEITNLSADISKLTQQFTRFSDEGVKHNLAIAKHTEQLFRFDRDLVETKDLLKTFMLKYDSFVSETTERFGDFELALSEVEKSIQPSTETANTEEAIGLANERVEDSVENEGGSAIESADLKSIVKRELAAGSNLD
jgi:hypothetical protein